MHRDNPAVPVGEFVDAMSQLRRAGQVRVLGVSNWTRQRFEQANQYARRKGLGELTVLSNNLSLARAADVPWGGCLACNDDAWFDWLKAKNVPVLQLVQPGAGLFHAAGPAGRPLRRRAVRCWYTADNFGRKQRAEQLAAERGVDPVAVALAWVLHQPFPTFALIGPRTLAEMRSSWRALAIELTAAEVEWLANGG